MARRLLLATVFATIALTVIGGLHYYLIRRLVFDPMLPALQESLGMWAIIGAGLSILLMPIGERVMPPPISHAMVLPGSVWMGLAFLLVSFLALSDLALVLTDVTPTIARWRAGIVLGIAGSLTVRGLFNGLRLPAVNRVEVPLARWPESLDGFRIAQLSDIHVGPIRAAGFARALTERVNGLKPDLIVITGDLVDGSVRHVGPMVEPFKDLSAPRGCWFVTGNHDMYSGPYGWMERVEQLGWTILRNEHRVLDDFVLAGVHDHQAGLIDPALAEDVKTALRGAPDLPTVLLAHDPGTFKVAQKFPVDLQISGHTHDGQIWPFKYLVRLVIPWVAGLYRVGDSAIFVSRGTGFWGPPMRLMAPAEITELILRPGS